MWRNEEDQIVLSTAVQTHEIPMWNSGPDVFTGKESVGKHSSE